MRRALLLLVGGLLVAGCTERLTSPGTCPSLCPGGALQVRDTIIEASPDGDSTFTGYGSVTEPQSLLVSNGGGLGEVRSLVRFIGRGDSTLVADTLRPFTIDSAAISVFLQARDTTVSSLKLDVYRLPVTFDSTTSFAELDAAMTPATLLRTVEIDDSARTGRLVITFTGSELAKLAYTPADSTRLVIGFRLRSPSPAGIYLGASRSGEATPLYLTYGVVDVADTALQHQTIQRGVSQNLNVVANPAAIAPELLRVGGFPAGRSLVRFAIPDYIRDSATIVRATLELVADQPVVGIPGDSARIDVRGLLADVGAKSPVNYSSSRLASTWIHPGTDTVRIDMANIVELWQGSSGLPDAVRIELGQEFASFIGPNFRSTRSATGAPRLRLTYRPPYALEGF